MRVQHTDTVVVGGGQTGLAVSWHLAQHSREHVVLERGLVANRWRTGGWDSLRLLTPNWMSRLPGWSYQGDEPDGFMSRRQLVSYLQAYARSIAAPVATGVTVSSVTHDGERFSIQTDRGHWSADRVVVATGACGSPHVPPVATHLPAAIHQLTPSDYRHPAEVAPGGVLVIGGSASGVQIAQELHRSGRRVVLSVGRHTRVPRSYRGMDIWWWLEQLGRLDRPVDDVRDRQRARLEPSLQLIGRTGTDLDLGVLAREGVAITGRLLGVEGSRVLFADDLTYTAAVADRRLRRLLDAIDSHVTSHGLTDEVLTAGPYRPAFLTSGPAELDLAVSGIRTVIWATGYRPRYPWLRLPVLDGTGQIQQHRGRTDVPGLYCAGLQFGQRRSSSLLDGARHDAAAIGTHVMRSRSGDPVGGPGRR